MLPEGKNAWLVFKISWLFPIDIIILNFFFLHFNITFYNFI